MIRASVYALFRIRGLDLGLTIDYVPLWELWPTTTARALAALASPAPRPQQTMSSGRRGRQPQTPDHIFSIDYHHYNDIFLSKKFSGEAKKYEIITLRIYDLPVQYLSTHNKDPTLIIRYERLFGDIL